MGHAVILAAPEVVIGDERGSRIVSRAEAAVRSRPRRDRMIEIGMTAREQEDRVYEPRFRRAHVLRPSLQRLVDTAPPIVKTTGLSKATRLAQSWQQHFDSWRAYLGRPMLVGDLSEQLRRAFHLDRLPDGTVITRALILRAAKRSLQDAENRMREAQNKRVTKEAFWVPPGVR